jgi:hypothetical protein
MRGAGGPVVSAVFSTVFAVTCTVAGCGARTLPGDGPPLATLVAPDAADDGSPPAQSPGQGSPTGMTPFYICPFAPPPADSACDAQTGQTCVYTDLPNCPSIVCTSGSWQPGPERC